MKLGAKIFLGFAVLIVLSIIMGAAAFLAMRNISNATVEQNLISMPVQDLSTDINREMQEATAMLLRVFVNDDVKYFDQVWPQITAAKTATGNRKID